MNLKAIIMPVVVSVVLAGCVAPQGGARSSPYRYTSISRAGGYQSGGVFLLQDGRVLYDKGNRRYFGLVSSEPAVPMEQAPVSDLITVLRDPSPVAALWAADALGAAGANAEAAVPALAAILNAKYPSSGAYGVIDADVQRAAARALGAVGAGARSAIEELARIAADTSRDAELRTAVKQAIAQIDPSVASDLEPPAIGTPQTPPTASNAPENGGLVMDKDAAGTSERPAPPPVAELKAALLYTLFPKASDRKLSLTDHVSFSPDGKWLMTWVEGYLPYASRYALFAASDGTKSRAFDRLGAKFGCGSAVIAPDSSTLSLLVGEGDEGQGIARYRIANGALVQSVTEPVSKSWEAVGMPDAQTLLLQKSEGSMTSPKSGAKISLLNLKSEKFLWSVSTIGPVMAISRDGRYIACATGSPKGGPAHAEGYPVQVISVEQPTATTSFVAHTQWIATLAFSPDSKMLASSGADEVVKLWSVPEGKLLHSFEGHQWTVNALRFSPDGNTLVSGGKDSTIRFWDIGRLAPIGCLTLSDSPISSMDIGPEGRVIAFGDEKGRVSVCDYAKVKALTSGTDIQCAVSSDQ